MTRAIHRARFRRQWLRALRRTELLLALCIVLVLVALQQMLSIGIVARAHLTETYLQFRPLQIDVVERIAATGRWEDPRDAPARVASEGSQAAPRRIASARELEEAQAGIARAERLATEAEFGVARRSQSPTTVAGLLDGVPVVAVAPHNGARPYLLEVRPLVATPLAGAVAWACGREPDLDGRPAPAPREPAVPPELLAANCKEAP